MDTSTAVDLIRRRAGDEAWARLSDSIGDDEVLLVSGSLVEGIGNPRSDLDFFVVTDDFRPDLPVRMAFAGESWLDIEYVRPGALEELSGKLSATDPADAMQVVRLSRPDLDRYYRMAIGVAVKGGSLRQPTLDGFAQLLRGWAVIQAGAFAARAVGAADAGEVAPAVLYASHAAHLCVLATLTDVGELYPSPKYTLEKAARAYGAGSPVLERIVALLHPAEQPERYVDRAVGHVDSVVTEYLSAMTRGGIETEPVTPLAYDRHRVGWTVMSRKTGFDVLPEDAAVIGAQLSIPELAAAGPVLKISTWLAEAHQLVLRQALVDLGLLKERRNG